MTRSPNPMETKFNGKKERTSLSKSLRRKIKRKEDRKRPNKSRKNHFSTSSHKFKSTATRKNKKKEANKSRISNANTKSLKISTSKFCQNHSSITWESTKISDLEETIFRKSRKRKKSKKSLRYSVF